MTNSKALLVLGLLLLAAALVSSAVDLRDPKSDAVAKEEEKQGSSSEVGREKYSRWCPHGCCGYQGGYCSWCCRTPEEARLFAQASHQEETNQVTDEKYHGGGWGGHGGGWGGGRCCGPNKAGQKETKTETTPQNLNRAEEANPVKEDKHHGWGGGRCCGKDKKEKEKQANP